MQTTVKDTPIGAAQQLLMSVKIPVYSSQNEVEPFNWVSLREGVTMIQNGFEGSRYFAFGLTTNNRQSGLAPFMFHEKHTKAITRNFDSLAVMYRYGKFIVVSFWLASIDPDVYDKRKATLLDKLKSIGVEPLQGLGNKPSDRFPAEPDADAFLSDSLKQAIETDNSFADQTDADAQTSNITINELKQHTRQLAEEILQQPQPVNGIHLPSTQHKSEISTLLAAAEVKPTDYVDKPPTCLEILDKGQSIILGTLGNFSLIIGKAKSRKTFLVSALVAAFVKSVLVLNRIRGCLTAENRVVLYIVSRKWTDIGKKRGETSKHFVNAEKYDFFVVGPLLVV